MIWNVNKVNNVFFLDRLLHVYNSFILPAGVFDSLKIWELEYREL